MYKYPREEEFSYADWEAFGVDFGIFDLVFVDLGIRKEWRPL